MSSRYAALLEAKGIPLRQMGWEVSDIVLSKRDVFTAVGMLKVERRPIVGGDVWLISEQRARPSYDNWCVDPILGESHEQYVERSHAEALEYLRRDPDGSGDRYYSLVLGSD